MARKTKASTKPKPAQDTITGMYSEGIESIADMNAVMMESFGDMSAQIADFFTQRIEQDVKVQHDLLQCKNLQEVQQVQMQFFQDAFKQYQANSAKMLEIGTQALHSRKSK